MSTTARGSTGGHFDRLGWGLLRVVWQHHTVPWSAATWLLTLEPSNGSALRFCLQARAVMDDFGSLVIVETWQ